MLESLREIWEYRALIGELVRRDLKLRYKNSIGGIAWSLLNPLMQIAVITVMMRFIALAPIKNYSAYLMGVIFLWNFFQVSMSDACASILLNSSLVRKVYFPRAIMPLTVLLGNLFHFGVSFVFTIVYFFILGAYPSNLTLHVLIVIPTIFFLSVLSLGLSFIFAYLNVFYEDVRFIVSMLTQLMFYAMPVFYTVEQVKAKSDTFYTLFMLNPVTTFLVTYQRSILRPPAVPNPKGVGYLPSIDIPWPFFGMACGVSVIILIIGFTLFERHQWEMVERL